MKHTKREEKWAKYGLSAFLKTKRYLKSKNNYLLELHKKYAFKP